MRRRCWKAGFWSFLVTLALGAPAISRGDDSPAEPLSEATTPPATTLVQLAEEAKQGFQPVSADREQAAKSRVQEAVAELEPFLGGAGPENEQQWKDYLKWSDLQQALAEDGPPNLGTLSSITSRLLQNHQGLELPQFTAVREALMDWGTTAALVRDDQLEPHYQQRLDELITWLPKYEAHPTVELGAQIGSRIAWLETAQLANELVVAVRQRYQQPNLVAAVSERLAAAGMRTEVEESSDVQDCILGTSIFGHATMQGVTNMKFVDNPEAANVELVLSGNIATNSMGYNRGVSIHSLGSTSVVATKQLTVDSDQIAASPAQASCATDTTVCSISAKSCLVEKLARRRVKRSKHEAEQIAARHAEVEVERKMDAQAEELLAQAQELYQEKFRKPLLRRGQFPQEMNFATHGQLLTLNWMQADQRQLAAPSSAPTGPDGSDLSVRVHESFVTNFSRALLGGVTLTDEMLAKILKDSTGSVPEELQVGPDSDPWSITFSSVKPVSAVFQDDTIEFAIRGTKFSRGDDVVPQDLEMSAVYKLQKTPAGARLIRQGDVSVEYVGVSGKLSVKQITVRTVMRKKFEALFEPEFNTTGIKMPGRWQNAGMLHLEHLKSNQGWVALDWIIQAAAPDLAAN
jgi:hypothetical protein